MKNGFIKVATGLFEVTVADVALNCKNIKEIINKADSADINLLVLPELCITGYTCADLFFNEALIRSAYKGLLEIAEFTKGKYPIVAVGLPFSYNSKLYNCAAILQDGHILGIVPKTYIPDYGVFNEKRYFEAGNEEIIIPLENNFIPFGNDIVFKSNDIAEYTFAFEICEDLFAADQHSTVLASKGANIILNLSASNEASGKADYRRTLVAATSARLNCGYVFASAGAGESTTDMCFSGHCLIAENGKILAENKPFCENSLTISEIDVNLLKQERSKNTSFISQNKCTTSFSQKIIETRLTRKISKTPFIPEDKTALESRCEEILQIQAHALKKRILHAGSKKAVIGISGGLDSTLALLVTMRAMKLLNRSSSDILAVTMPCFGTSERTRSNSEILCNELKTEFKIINITDSVKQHFKDIDKDQSLLDTTFENSQARERTQVLMDLANSCGGLVIGTGDLSELALGWATYGGDHLSMYGVNASLPKTLIRELVKYEAANSKNQLKKVLLDILDTPVSPELLPLNQKGEIAQKTEDLVGPYELHDFFIYYHLRYGFSPEKIYRLAKTAFNGVYSEKVILNWLKVFTKRFFTQQFKRSCLPDGPCVGSVGLSPRSGLKMPSDAAYSLWLEEISKIKE